MIRKSIILTSILIVFIIIAITVWVRSGNSNLLKNTNTADIAEITISDPTKYYTITKQEDIESLLKVLQLMDLKRKVYSVNKDGFTFTISMKLINGESIEISILSGNIKINNQNYKLNKDYCYSIREIFDTLAQKYVNIPS